MPDGITAIVDDGFAVIDFVDPKLRGPALIKLIEIGGPQSIDVDTRTGPRKLYIVPEGNASEAGLLDSSPSGPVLRSAGADSGHAGALSSADPFAADSGVTRPEQNVSQPHVGPAPQSEVLRSTSIQTTLATGTPTEPAIAQPHHELVAASKIATPENVGQKTLGNIGGGDPSLDWSFADLKAFASAMGKDVRGIRSSKEMLAAIES